MKKIEVKIIDPVGLHARPASVLVQEANKFDSDIKIVYGEKEANLKSIMSVMSMGVKTQEKIIIEANGSDEEKALTAIESALKKNNLI